VASSVGREGGREGGRVGDNVFVAHDGSFH